VDLVQALLGAVGDLKDVIGLPGLAVGERGAERGCPTFCV